MGTEPSASTKVHASCSRPPHAPGLQGSLRDEWSYSSVRCQGGGTGVTSVRNDMVRGMTIHGPYESSVIKYNATYQDRGIKAQKWRRKEIRTSGSYNASLEVKKENLSGACNVERDRLPMTITR